MSFHVLHIFQHGATLAKERGFIVCRSQTGEERRLPHADLRAVVIAARGVTLTSHFVSTILEGDGVILHCDATYKPCGITAALGRVVDRRAFLRQASRPQSLNSRLWKKMLLGKTENQLSALRELGLSSTHLAAALKSEKIDEGNAARHYWKLFFPAIGHAGTGRERTNSDSPNQMLNYGYAVLAALCHRGLLVHGLLPELGVQHTTRYRSSPLVFDLMEPFRPIVDCLLARFLNGPETGMKAWTKFIGNSLRDHRVSHARYSLKLMDSINAAASSLARAYSANSAKVFWIPKL